MSSSIIASIFGTPPQPRAQPVTVIQTSTPTDPVDTGSTGIPLARSTQSTANQSPSSSFPSSSSASASPSVSPSQSLITVTTTSIITSAVVAHKPVSSPVIFSPRHGGLLGAAIVGAIIGGILALLLPLLLWSLLKKRPKRDPSSSTDTAEGDEKFYNLFQPRASVTTPFYLPQMDNVIKQGLMNNADRIGAVGNHEATSPLEILRALRMRAHEGLWRSGYAEQPVVRGAVETSQSIASDRSSYSCTVSTLPLYHE